MPQHFPKRLELPAHPRVSRQVQPPEVVPLAPWSPAAGPAERAAPGPEAWDAPMVRREDGAGPQGTDPDPSDVLGKV